MIPESRPQLAICKLSGLQATWLMEAVWYVQLFPQFWNNENILSVEFIHISSASSHSDVWSIDFLYTIRHYVMWPTIFRYSLTWVGHCILMYISSILLRLCMQLYVHCTCVTCIAVMMGHIPMWVGIPLSWLIQLLYSWGNSALMNEHNVVVHTMNDQIN